MSFPLPLRMQVNHLSLSSLVIPLQEVSDNCIVRHRPCPREPDKGREDTDLCWIFGKPRNGAVLHPAIVPPNLLQNLEFACIVQHQ